MDVARALLRLLIVSAVGWLAFWGWRYVDCIHAQGTIFFCPDTSGQALVRTDGLRMVIHLLALPLVSAGAAFWIWRNQRLGGDQTKLGSG
jgi:hypothetical protein